MFRNAGATVFLAALLALGGSGAAAREGEDAGMVKVKSAHSVNKTLDRAEAALREKGLKVFARIDHAAAAREYGLEMKPTVVFIFGNPKTGTPNMITNPMAAIDFPLKGIVYEDADGQIWLAYNSADYVFQTIFARHGLPFTQANIDQYGKLLANVAANATQ